MLEAARLQSSAQIEGRRRSHGSSELEGLGTRSRAALGQEPRSRVQVASFLSIQFLAFASELAALVNFALSQDWWFFTFILLPFLFSGSFCAHAAWHCDVQGRCVRRCLPLRDWPTPAAILLALPLGLGQGVIALLALEEYETSRFTDRESADAPAVTAHAAPRIVSNKFHCAAVNGLFEGLPSSAVILYAFWSIGFPSSQDPLTQSSWHHERSFVGLLGVVLLLASGLGLLELDCCTSRTIARRMRRNSWYEMVHWVFRTTEVASRLSIHVCFMVTTRRFVCWWCMPIAVDILTTILLVMFYGGAEAVWGVRLLISLPCNFANVFLFIDSPYKRRAAMHLSRALTLKHLIALVLLPLLVYGGAPDLKEALEPNWEMHKLMIVFASFCIVTHLVLLSWIAANATFGRGASKDIYSACAEGSVQAVHAAIRHLTHSAAVGLNVNCPDIDGYTPLMLAAVAGHVNVCHALLREGARVDVRVFEDRRPLRKCIVSSVDRRWTALHMAAWRGHAEVVKILVEAIPTAQSFVAPYEDFKDTHGDTPLHVAVKRGHSVAARVLAIVRRDWVDAPNNRMERPIDLTADTEVQSAVAQSHELGPRSNSHRSPLLACSQGPQIPEIEMKTWLQVQLPISRSSPVQLIAPGLCSYIASSCGGALGRIFLVETGVPTVDIPGSFLSRISEASDSSCSSMGFNLPPILPSVVTSFPEEPEPCMEDLEPVDNGGRPSSWWEGQRGPRVTGRSLTCLPPEAVLGEGSYGRVWRARDKNTKRWYAVKNIQPFQTVHGAIALRECEVADHIRLTPHPCLVQLHAVKHFTDNGLYVLVMEFCPGGDLLGRIRCLRREARNNGSLYQPPPQALSWIGQVFLGLEHMHLRMLTLLRDLKPDNVVLTADGHAKLTDFGFGRFGVESSGVWSFGIPSGSPGYVAPEVLHGEAYNERADLYSLGVLIWVLLTGGIKDRQQPGPPLGPERTNQNVFAAHFHDYKLLRGCILEPEQNKAQQLPEGVLPGAVDLVMRLTERVPDRRGSHTEIRTSRLLLPLHMPAYNARPLEVTRWRDSTSAAL